MEFLYSYGLFLAKAVTILVALLVFIGFLASLRMREKSRLSAGHIEVEHWNEKIGNLKKTLQQQLLDKAELKQLAKSEKVEAKQKAKQEKKKQSAEGTEQGESTEGAKRAYLLNFHGDIRAHAVDALREEITAILSMAEPGQEVVLRLESAGGLVHAYGLAASQLLRIKDKGLRLTVCIDKLAASGGYMMACVADRICAAPFAVIGSIGVLAQLPNFHRLLKRHDIDFELLTAGEYKRTMTMLGENTEKGRQKFQQDLEDTHELFKQFVNEHRGQVDIQQVATGEIWFGQRALDKQLVDSLQTSDAYIVDLCDNIELYEVKYIEKKPLQERISLSMQSMVDNLGVKWLGRLLGRHNYF